MQFKGKDQLVKIVQKKLGLSNDGVDGPKTWKTLADYPFEVAKENVPQKIIVPQSQESSSFSKKLLTLATGEIGVSEVNGTNCGPRVDQYKSATWLDSSKGFPWCAAFICWLFREAMGSGIFDFKRPQTAGAWDFENWAKDQKGSVLLKKPHNNDIQAGDIVIFNFSHIGIAASGVDSAGFVNTIEGNTDDAGSREGGSVLRKKRKVSQIRSIIRITK
jgi:hypothetical protein